jgi:phosphodiesterase/alkaline phosphatase D-like protein
MELRAMMKWCLLMLGAVLSIQSSFGAGNPILLVGTSSNQFSFYYSEILRAEGLNAFDTADISAVSAATLSAYDVVILGQAPLTSAQVTMFTNWVNGGGNLIAMRPDKQLATLLGIGDTGTTLSNGYLLVNTSGAPGAGIVGQTIQFHGTADLYLPSGASTVATLYSSASAATSYPAVTLRTGIGTGGNAAAFTYDLASSIVYTRQGNPAWAGQARVAQGGPIRAGDMFYGKASFDPQPDWVDLNNIAIPQADEQQRLLSNIILYLNQSKKPLPRFWYFPFGKKAAVIMTGDDHANGGTAVRFDDFIASSPAGCSVANWECIRSTSYIYAPSPLTNAQAASYTAQGFEVALHVNTNCSDYTPSSLESFFASQLSAFASAYPGVPSPSTNRTHCIAWSDWASTPQVELNHGIRLDTTYYYWPPSWLVSTPGFFTGSGIPMRFAQTNGSLIDVYQATSQMTDESGQAFPATINGLLDNAVGPAGFYGAFTANMHTDYNNCGTSCPDGKTSEVSAQQIVSSAQSHGVPVVSSKQMLQWLDGRNGSSFGSLSWSGNTLAFSVTAAGGANGLQAMLPTASAVGVLSSLTQVGSPVSYSLQTIKGIQYAFFSATSGTYQATYAAPLPPVITAVTATPGTTTATITWTTDKSSNSRVDYGTSPTALTLNSSDPALVTSHSIGLTGLATGTAYYFRVTSADSSGNSATSPPTAGSPASFTTVDPTPPVISAVTATSGLNATATITWSTNKLSNSRVDYGTSSASLTLNVTNASMVTAHSLTLAGLTQDTTYYYRVTSADSLGNSAASPVPPATASFVETTGVSVWNPSVTPVAVDAGDANALEVGMKFRSEIAGVVTGVRYYKAAANTGTHTGNLWTSAGALLGTVTFINETTSGWQQANFATPISIAANTTYIVSYFTPTGHYSANGGFFASAGVDNPPLHALASSVDGPNGVYRYGATSAFPNSSFNNTNYWVDLVFTNNLPPVISAVNAAVTATTATITWTTNAASNSRVDYGTAPGALTQSATNASMVTAHSITLTGLTSGTTYYYRVTSADTFGNSATSPDPTNQPSNFTPTSDTTPPVISAVTATPGTTTAAITWTTDELSSSRVDYGTSSATLNLNASIATLVTSHSITLNGLTQGVTYFYRVTSADGSNNTSTSPNPPSSPSSFTENLVGNPPGEWDISGSGDASIQGFTTDISANLGDTVHFKIKSTAAAYHLDIYRMGYYGGNGALKVATITPSTTLPQTQPTCLTDAPTGLIDCGNWAESATWTIPLNAKSGIYFAKVIRDDNSGASHIVFVVRDDSSHSEILFQTSDTTWQAYNQYGGNSLYVGSPAGRAYKVSYNRPITTRGTSPEDFVFNAEYPMVRWLEANGYDVSYTTGIDTERRGALITNHKTFMSVGHDEYWSGTQRANVEAARDAGVNMAFFSGNEVFWKTRWENSISSPATSYRTLVCYKETHANAVIDPLDPPTWTGTWRDPRFSPPADGGRPENALTGTIFLVNSGTPTLGVSVPEADGKMRFWRNTTVATQSAGATATLTAGMLGYEWDQDPDNGSRPAGLIRLSTTLASGAQVLQDYGSTYGTGSATHNATLHRRSNGALVFGAGTVQWSWGLDSNHDRSQGSAADVRVQQATINLLADMGVQPATIQSGLVPATRSTDATPPVSTITSPAAGATVASNSTVTITGTASDTGGVVGAVEVSVDGGLTWHPATGRSAWSYSWATGASRTAQVMSRAVDDSGNIQTALTSITVTVGSGTVTCPCTIWPSSATPATASDPDTSAVELGVKFRSDVIGQVTAIRFYKGTGNTGNHLGHLWSSTGTLLGTATFAGETASGWQQANLTTPVSISANTTYVVSYYAPVGRYAANAGFFSTGVDNGPLHALANSVSANGVYIYGASAFPNQTFNATNYWVDLVFVQGPSFSISGSISGSGGSGATVNLSGGATASTVADASGNYTLSSVPNGSYTVTPVKAGFTFTPASRSVVINGADAVGVSFTSTAGAIASLSPTSVAFANQPINTTSAAQNVTLSNTGGSTLTISSIAIAGANPGDFAQTNTCGTSVAAGANCTISVTFTPTVAAARTATLSISDNAAGSPQTVSLSGTGTGTGTPPVAGLSPTSVVFANQQVNTTSAAQNVTLSNTGGSTLTISSIAITGANPGDFAQTNTCGTSVAAGANCTISVTFRPTATGSRTASVSIADNAAGSPQAVALSGTGASAAVTLSPASLAFGNQPVNTTSAAQTVTLSNTGNTALTITGISITGTNAGNFAQTNTCGTSVAAGANCAISVTFRPTATGSRTASLSVADSAAGSPQTVALSGTGTRTTVTLSPTSLAFGNQLINTTSAAQTVTLSNTGTAILTITGISITGTNSGNFAQTNTCGTSVAAGANCTISITFRPTATGSRTASLSVADNGVGSPQTVGLSGTGARPVVTFSPTSLAFGNQPLNTTSAAQTLTLSNTGTAILTITGVSITGTNAGNFAQTNNCGTSIAAGANCTISVTFRPTATGSRTASVSVADNAAGSPQRVTLSGTGI